MNKTLRNILLGAAVVNVGFCAIFIASNMNNSGENLSDVPQITSEIPFIPEDEKLNPVQIAQEEVVVEEIKPAILEGKTEKEIKDKLAEKTKDISTKDPINAFNMPSLAEVVKNEKVLSCHIFVRDNTLTDQDKFIKKEDC